jgi:UDP-N-acetylglucosamine--N-acetylmuramyl-(pentapeptide) pyrophosphoryl-undecaprenol N-acetylglucosamine transferase
VIGGSQGDEFLNQQVPSVLESIQQQFVRLQVSHQVGHGRSPQAVKLDYQGRGIAAEVFSFTDSIAPYYQKADFVISSAGAISLQELAAAEKPCLIVPLEGASHQHQHENAKCFAEETGVPSFTRETWEPRAVTQAILPILIDANVWNKHSHAIRAYYERTNGDSLAQIIIERMNLSQVGAVSRP